MLYTEQLSRKFTPAGQDQPPERKSYNVSGDYEKALQALGKWLDEYESAIDERAYERACKLTEGLGLYISEINSLIVPYRDHKHIRDAGLFLSAFYNQSPDDVIVWNMNTSIHELGRDLPEDKIFVNMGRTGDWMGYEASGIMINFGETGYSMGKFADGVVINYGKSEKWMGQNATGIVIAVKDPECFSDELYNAKLVLREQDCVQMPELVRYLDNLRRTFETGKDGDYEALVRAIDEFGPNPRQRIEQDIKSILRSHRYEV